MDQLLAGFGVANGDIQALRATRGAWSENTKRALRSDLEIFGNWCVGNGLQVLPAKAETVARFVDSVAHNRAPATLKRYVSNIGALHKAAGYAKPSDAAVVRLALQYMQRHKDCRQRQALGRPRRVAVKSVNSGHKDCRQRQALGLTWEMRDRMIAATGGRLPDLRDRALLAVMCDAMLRVRNWLRWKYPIYRNRKTAERRCWCAEAKPIRPVKARKCISLRIR